MKSNNFKNHLANVKNKLNLETVKIQISARESFSKLIKDERGDVPGWVLVVLMTTGLVTAIWAIANPKLTSILRNSLDAMNGVR
jgi:hypothetical protein